MPTAPRRRTAFTLVEMMMVVVIIGILASLIGVAASAAVRAARRAAILTELTQLDMAMKRYDTENGGTPPCLGSINTRHTQFVAHVRRAFPRYVPQGDPSKPNDVPYKKAAFDINKAYVDKYKDEGFASPGRIPNLDHLDQAEALVFWLGGLPTPLHPSDPERRLGTTKLTGFSLAASNPFELLSSSRRPPLYEFDESRLTDYDNDGWLEYIPPGRFAATVMPPYVYFDKGSYTPGNDPATCCYPFDNKRFLLTPRERISEWGTIVPYLRSAKDARSMAMMNPDSFQIISAGIDSVYSAEGMLHSGGHDADKMNWAAGWPVTSRVDNSSYLFWPVFETGANYGDSEGDNLTNFYAEGEIQDVLE